MPSVSESLVSSPITLACVMGSRREVGPSAKNKRRFAKQDPQQGHPLQFAARYGTGLARQEVGVKAEAVHRHIDCLSRAVRSMNLKHILRQIEPNCDNLRHDRSPL